MGRFAEYEDDRMEKGFVNANPFPQPQQDFSGVQVLHGMEEEVEFLPGTSIRIWFTYLPNGYPLHWHSCMEIIEGVHSYYTCQANGETYVIHPGEMLILPGGVPHSATPGPQCNGWTYLFELGWLDQIPSCQALKPLLQAPLFISQQETPILFMNLSSHLSQMRNDYFSDNDQRELLFNAGVLRIMEQLLSFHQRGRQEEDSQLDKRHAHQALFSQVISYIDENFSREMTLDDLARRFNLSTAYFSRLFTQYVHEPFSDYLVRRRLKEAEILLADPALSVTDVALKCGYGSLSAFSRAFLAQRKCTPSQYRKIYVRFAGDSLGNQEA